MRAPLLGLIFPLLGLIAPSVEGPALPPEDRATVCVLAPHVGSDGSGRASALVPLARPTIFAAGQFAELRIEQQGRLLWRRQASAEQPLEGPIAWPLAPIRSGESLRLLLRPSASPRQNFAVIGLIGGAAAEMRRGQHLLERLGRNPAAWVDAVQQQLDAGDTALASALLFAFEGPDDPKLNSLRRAVIEQSCLRSDPADRFAPLTTPQPAAPRR